MQELGSMKVVDESYAHHVSNTNRRLIQLSEKIASPLTYADACRELTEWCSDARAFSAVYERNLMIAIEAAFNACGRPGFETELAMALIAACHVRRKHLCKEKAGMITRWHELLKRRRSKSKQCTKSVSTVSMWGPPSASPMVSPSFPTMQGQQFMQNPPGYPQMSPSPYPVDPSGARPIPHMDPAMYDQNMQMQNMQQMQMQQMTPQQQQMLMQREFIRQQQQRAMMMHQQQQMAAARRGMPSMAPNMAIQPQMPPSAMAPAGMQQSPISGMPAYQSVPMATTRAPGQMRPLMMYGSKGEMMSPSYPQPTQMVAGPPMLYGQMAVAQQQQVVSYPNPHVSSSVLLCHPPSEVLFFIRHDIMPQFTLEHNHDTTDFTFNISQEDFQNLQSNSSYDVHLKCYHKQSRMSQWPGEQQYSVHVTVNQNSLVPPSKFSPISLRNVIRQGENQLTMRVTSCACSHAFVMTLVQSAPLPQVVAEITKHPRNTNLTPEMCCDKLRNLIAMEGCASTKLSLCTIPGKRMRIPSRSRRCSHSACVDLEVLLGNCFDGAMLQCPICNQRSQIHEIEVDMFVGKILKETESKQSLEAIVDSNGHWRAIEGEEMPSRKRATPDNAHSDSAIKRIKSEPFYGTMSHSSPQMADHCGPMSVGQVKKEDLMSPAGMPAMSPFHNSPMKSVPAIVPSPSSAGRMQCEPLAGPATPGVQRGISPRNAQPSQGPASVSGSAPYTPSSVSSSTVNTWSVDSLALDIEIDPLVPTAVNTTADIHKYLKDTGDLSLAMFDDLRFQNGDTPPTSLTDHWRDVESIISSEARS